MPAVPSTTDALVISRRPDTENADPRADVNDDIWIWITEVKRFLFTQLRITGIVKIIAFTAGAVSVNEVDPLKQAIQLIKFSQVEVYALHKNTQKMTNEYIRRAHCTTICSQEPLEARLYW